VEARLQQGVGPLGASLGADGGAGISASEAHNLKTPPSRGGAGGVFALCMLQVLSFSLSSLQRDTSFVSFSRFSPSPKRDTSFLVMEWWRQQKLE